tara:strand:+ start:207 stop:377 length:171 start_codon:yes stop_codon:yes gene_type:complete
MNTLEQLKSSDIPKEQQLESICEFIDSLEYTNFWDYYGADRLEKWLKDHSAKEETA